MHCNKCQNRPSHFGRCLLLGMWCQSLALAARGAQSDGETHGLRFLPSNTTDFQNIVVHRVENEPDRVYIGATNALFRAKRTGLGLQVEQASYQQPVLDHVDCPPLPTRCDKPRKFTNTKNKLLLLEPGETVLLSCGDTLQGQCRRHRISNITKFSHVNGTGRRSRFDPYNSLAGRRSAVAFFAPGQKHADWVPHVLYTAVEYDRRPLELFPPMLSTRILVRQSRDDSLRFQLGISTDDFASALSVQGSRVDSHTYRFVYGFSHGDYSYYVAVAKKLLSSSNRTRYETRVLRVCHVDYGYLTHTEVAIACVSKERSGGRRMTLAQAAMLAIPGSRLALRINATVNESVLFVAFGCNRPEKITADASYGSSVCAFSMNALDDAFKAALQRCFRGQGHVIPWFRPDTPCEDTRPGYVQRAIQEDYFCGDYRPVINTPVIGRKTEKADAVFDLVHDVITFLSVDVFLGHTVLVLGTRSGRVLKAKLEYSHSKAAYDIHLNSGPILRSSAVAGNYAYVLTREKLFLLPIRSCNVYTSCKSCVSSQDPLHCVWCGDRCRWQTHCGKPPVTSEMRCTTSDSVTAKDQYSSISRSAASSHFRYTSRYQLIYAIIFPLLL